MASSLIQTREQVRKYAIYFGIFIVVVILLQICLNFISGLGSASEPGGSSFYPYREIDNVYGVIDLPEMSWVSINNSSRPEFSVDNDFEAVSFKGVNVYKVEQPRERFSTEVKAKDLADRFDFEGDPDRSGDILTWRSGTKVFKYDKLKQQLDFKNIFVSARGAGFKNDEQVLKGEALDLIKDLGLNRPNLSLDAEKIKIDYLNLSGGKFSSATSPGTADYIKINVYRNLELASLPLNADGKIDAAIDNEYDPIDAIVYSEDYQSAPLEIVVASADRALSVEDLYSVDYTDWNILTDETPGVYEALSPQEAWDNVKAGQGSLQELTEVGFDRFSTGKDQGKDVLSFTASYLDTEVGYMQPDEWSGYLYPIYIFRGKARLANSPDQDNANFVFYAYAIRNAAE